MTPIPEHPQHDPFEPRRLSLELQALSESAAHEELTLGHLVDRHEGRVYTLLLVLLALPFCQQRYPPCQTDPPRG